MSKRVTLTDWLLLAGLVACWGISFAMSKVALQAVKPEWIAAIRLVIGAGVLLVAGFARGQFPRGDGRHLMIYVWLGLIGNAAPFLAITWAMQFIPSGVAGLLMGTIPLFVLVLAHLALPDEHLTPPRIAGFSLGFLGIVLLVGPDKLLAIKLHGHELLGEAAVVLGCLMYGLNAVSAKRLKLEGGLGVAAGVLTAGAVMAVCAAFLSGSPPDPSTLPLAPALALFGLGLLPTGLATLMWFKLVERVGPTFTSMSNYLVPICALAVGAVALGEPVGWNVLAALCLVLLGIFVSRISSLRLRPWK
jgi:drug/metabolite transporter (DMT)-like permease